MHIKSDTLDYNKSVVCKSGMHVNKENVLKTLEI